MPKTIPIADDVRRANAAADAEPPPHLTWCERRNRFRSRLQERPLPSVGGDEVDVHFAGMPSHYWEQVNEGDLAWALETIHSFLEMIASPDTPGTMPRVTWRQEPEEWQTRVMLCSWDRRGLLAKCAACFSTVKLNILQADAYTCADNHQDVAHDTFHVTDDCGQKIVDPHQLEQLRATIESALSVTEPLISSHVKPGC